MKKDFNPYDINNLHEIYKYVRESDAISNISLC